MSHKTELSPLSLKTQSIDNAKANQNISSQIHHRAAKTLGYSGRCSG
jgi:hypothetical protein